MDAELALKYVQMKHPPAWPNEGFRYQLKLFEGGHNGDLKNLHEKLESCARRRTPTRDFASQRELF